MEWQMGEIGMAVEILKPSYHGEQCRHNGENPDYEAACDECDFYLACFPDWIEQFHPPKNTHTPGAPGVCVNDEKVTLAYFLINLPSREVSSRARAIFMRSGRMKGITHMLSTETTLMAPLVWV